MGGRQEPERYAAGAATTWFHSASFCYDIDEKRGAGNQFQATAPSLWRVRVPHVCVGLLPWPRFPATPHRCSCAVTGQGAGGAGCVWGALRCRGGSCPVPRAVWGDARAHSTGISDVQTNDLTGSYSSF